jgi:hypothetical protein
MGVCELLVPEWAGAGDLQDSKGGGGGGGGLG